MFLSKIYQQNSNLVGNEYYHHLLNNFNVNRREMKRPIIEKTYNSLFTYAIWRIYFQKNITHVNIFKFHIGTYRAILKNRTNKYGSRWFICGWPNKFLNVGRYLLMKTFTILYISSKQIESIFIFQSKIFITIFLCLAVQ